MRLAARRAARAEAREIRMKELEKQQKDVSLQLWKSFHFAMVLTFSQQLVAWVNIREHTSPNFVSTSLYSVCGIAKKEK